MFETFDHTADLGLRARAADLNTLFAEAGRALSNALVENLDAVKPVRAVEVELPEDDDLEYLLLDWLQALLTHFEMERLVFSAFDVRSVEGGLKATASGEELDETRHEPAHEVKAITYHGLVVRKEDGGWLAEVIVDI